MFTSTIRLFIPPRSAPTSAVPLAVWASPLDGAHDHPSGSPWLGRLINEYAPEGKPVLLYTPTARSSHKSSDDAAASLLAAEQSAQPSTPAGLVIALLHHTARDGDELGRHVRSAATGVDAGGRLAVVTSGGQRRQLRDRDPVVGAVEAASRLGLGFLQHLIVTDLGELATGPRPPLPSGRASVPVHRTAHLDVTVFQAPHPVENAGVSR
jgi:hypothetical protein